MQGPYERALEEALQEAEDLAGLPGFDAATYWDEFDAQWSAED